MNARRLAVATATALTLSAASLTGTAAATPPEGAISCVNNTVGNIVFLLENGYVRPAPPCKPLS